MVFKKNDEVSKIIASSGGNSTHIKYKIRENNIKNYNLNPKLCKICSKFLSYEKRYNIFCSHSCAAKFNNLGVVRNGESLKKCISCGKLLRKQAKKRCKICETIYKIENGKHVCKGALRNYLIKINGYKCEQCGNTHWQGVLIPIDVHHIDGNKKNNVLTNLKLLCKNCHALTENYGYKKARRYI